MPIEIRELHIKIQVNTGKGGERNGPARTGANSRDKGSDAKGGPAATAEIVSESVEQVLSVLRNQKER